MGPINEGCLELLGENGRRLTEISGEPGKARHSGLVGLVPAWDGTGWEFDSLQCRIYIPCSLSIGFLLGSLGTYGLTQKLCLK